MTYVKILLESITGKPNHVFFMITGLQTLLSALEFPLIGCRISCCSECIWSLNSISSLFYLLKNERNKEKGHFGNNFRFVFSNWLNTEVHKSDTLLLIHFI